MEIEGFSEIISMITLAKELHDIDRDDIVQDQFFDVLSWDSYYENILGAISSVFSGFYSDYNDESEEECLIFRDECISEYYEMAWKYGRSHNVSHDKNPYVIEADNEVSRQLNYCYSMGWRLLGYTRTKKTARQSKLIVYIGNCGCDCHGHLAYGLIQLYKWFSDKVMEYKEPMEVIAA